MESIPNYHLEGLLGESSHSKVYVGYYDRVPYHKLVIKILKTDLVSENLKSYFLQKIEHLKILKGDALMIPLSYQEVMGTKFITREYDAAITLRNLMDTDPNFLIENFFTFAVQMANLLDQIHGAGVIHGGIKPNNILIDPKTLKIKLIDFITPFDVRNVSHFIYDKDFIRNTLAYTSPEQTGRINHRVEFTTDIYSLGIIFFEILTESLPFQFKDPLELIHAHLAEEVMLTHQLKPGLPKALGKIVEKMLSKQPEKRYQRGFGLSSDLGRCKKMISNASFNEVFSLGRNDRSHRVTFISKMVGRKQEADLILGAYKEVAQGGFKSILISGLSGIGKTRLIQELQKPIVKNKGYFTSGKYDVYQKNIPYSSLIQAFRNLIRTFLTESDERVFHWKKQIQSALGSNGGLLTAILPELLILLGPQNELPKASPVEARNRFNLVFSNFLLSLASEENPLVLFIDDLQWCDLASFEFISNIFKNAKDHKYLLLLGAYRNNEVDSSHPLVKMMAHVKHVKGPLKEIHLGAILAGDTHEMVSYILDEPMELTRELSDFLHKLTEGNPLFVSEGLSYLYNEGLLFFDEQMTQWLWSIDKIRDSNMPASVVGLFSSKVKQLPENSIELLEFCACMGNLFTPSELALVREIQLIDVYEILKPVLGQGLLVENKEQLQFVHDKVQEATLLLVDRNRKQKIHRQIGYHMYRSIPADIGLEKIDNIFTIASHLNIAYRLGVESHVLLPYNEKEELAILNFHAGNAALNSLATVAANEFFLLSQELLPDDRWTTHYELSYRIYQKLAKTTLMVGEYDSSEKIIDELLSNAQTDLDKAEALAEQTTSLSSIGNFIKAIESANRGLTFFNKAIPISGPEASEKCLGLIKAIHSGGHNVWQKILDMPFTQDRKSKVELAFYSELIPDLYMSGLVSQLYLAAAQSTQHCLEGGMDESVIYSFSIMGLNLGEQEQFENAFKYEDLAKNLCERYPNTFGATRGMNGVVWCNMHSRSHPRDIVAYCLKAIQSGKNCGDLYNAGLSYGPLVWNLQIKGTDFFEIESYVKECFEFSTKFQLTFSVGLAEAMMAGWVLPMKKNYIPSGMDEKLKRWESANHIASIGSYYVHLALTSFYCGHYEEAGVYIDKVRTYLHGLTDNVLKRQWYVLQVWNELKLHEQNPNIKSKQEVLNKIGPILEKLQKWADLGSLLRPYLMFAYAEKQRLEVGLEEAWNKYFGALNEAHVMGYLFFEGYIYESLAKLSQPRNFSLAKFFALSALNLYRACNAERKVFILFEAFGDLLSLADASANKQPEPTVNEYSQSIRDIDDFYFIKASQAISAVVDNESLMHKSIEVFTESTGAQYGVFTLINAGEIESVVDYVAKMSVAEGKELSPFSAFEKLSGPRMNDLDPNIQSLLRYVLRTKETIVINRENRASLYKEFIDFSRVKAILCLPIVKKDNVLGIIYLENRITDLVFTSVEVQMVKLLSVQTAISLENILLYEEVQRENSYRKKVEADLISSKELADRANSSKTQFLANMSHEIRTPLHSIIGVTDWLLESTLAEEQRNFVNMARNSGENLLYIINDILDISRIESGYLSLETVPFVLSEEVEKAIGTISVRADAKKIGLEWKINSDVINYRIGDPTRLKQIMINLLNNALKFSNHGKISLVVTTAIIGEDSRLIFSVSDQGVGIPQEKLSIIFDRFQQVDASITRVFGGSGLGLTISKKIVELMNGKIWVESDVGQGSTFWFEVQLPVDKDREARVTRKAQELSRVRAIGSKGRETPRPLHILLADDAEDNRLIFAAYLKNLPYLIKAVPNGLEAFEAFVHGNFDLVFMDIQMPILDGHSATRRIRDWEKFNNRRETAIIAFTANAYSEDILASKAAGCNDHIVKPLKKEKLLSVIHEVSALLPPL